MKCLLKGKFLAVNEGVFEDKATGKQYEYATLLLLTDKGGQAAVEKCSIKADLPKFKKLSFGDEISLECDVTNYNNKISIRYNGDK